MASALRKPITGVWGLFGRLLQAANLSTILKFGNAKKITDICVVFAKMKSNKLRYGTD